MTDPTPTPTPETRTMVLSPLSQLLRSRKVMVALFTAIINLLIPFAPGLEAHREDLLTVALIVTPLLAATLIHGITTEDAAGKSGATATVSTGGAGGTATAQVVTPPAAPANDAVASGQG